ncbi:hypothetical protein ACG9XR_07005 [Acinetobacter guillouiae]|uniref:hypothetical protein n=1 Tax=Acinetobacter guillouiae TaxID=106649 RepID=UPI003AF65E37
MKKLLLICFFLTVSGLSFAGKQIDLANFQKTITKNPKININCQINNFSLMSTDRDFSSKLQSTLNTFGSMRIKDFDKGDCVQLSNFQDNIFTTYIWQNQNSIFDTKVDLFIAYNLKSKDLLGVIIDQNKNAYVLGDNKGELKQAIKSNPIYKNNLYGVNLDSSLNFSNFSQINSEDRLKRMSSTESFVYNVQNAAIDDKECNIDNFKLLETDSKFKAKLSMHLSEFGGLRIDDFDMGECLNSKSVTNGLLITKFWQKNKDFYNNNLSLYVAYNVYENLALLVIVDDDEKSYLLGDNTQALKNSLSNNENLKDDYKLSYDYSKLNFNDFKEKIDSQKIRDKEVEKILNPDWVYSCKKDRFTNDKSCYLFKKDLSLIYLNGVFGVVVGGNHFPSSTGSLKIDKNATLNAKEGKFFSNTLSIINQLKNGKVAYTRYKKWPYEYNVDNEVELEGFKKSFDEMIAAYKKL